MRVVTVAACLLALAGPPARAADLPASPAPEAQGFSAQRLSRIAPNLDDAARALGADRARVLAEVHVPLLWPGVATAALLVMVEVVKELPATALLRPLGRDTLAILTWEATKDARFDTAAVPALLIVAVGLLPVLALQRLRRREGPPALVAAAPGRPGR